MGNRDPPLHDADRARPIQTDRDQQTSQTDKERSIRNERVGESRAQFIHRREEPGLLATKSGPETPPVSKGGTEPPVDNPANVEEQRENLAD